MTCGRFHPFKARRWDVGPKRPSRVEDENAIKPRYAEIKTVADLRLVDLREDHAIRMGVSTDVAKSSRETLARTWSLAFHEHRSVPDGIIYPSRLNGRTNLAIFDRAISKLSAVRVVPLIGAPSLEAQRDELNKLTDGGTRNFADGYDYLRSVIGADPPAKFSSESISQTR